MTRATYAGSVGHERTLLVRVEREGDRGAPTLELVALFRDRPDSEQRSRVRPTSSPNRRSR